MMMGLQLMVLSRQMCLLDLNCCHSTLQWMQLSLLLFGLQREDFAFLEEADDCHPGLQAGMFGCGRQRLCVCMCVCVCVCVCARERACVSRLQSSQEQLQLARNGH